MDVVKAANIAKWYGMKSLLRVAYDYYDKKDSYAGTSIITVEESNRIIHDAIINGQPFMAGRFGSCELNIMWRASEKGHKWDVTPTKGMRYLHECAGFFPNTPEAGLDFAYEMKSATRNVDLLGVWFNPMEDYELRKWRKENYHVCRIADLEPFFSDHPWTLALKGKRVLVIHPFEVSIQSQYKRKDDLFKIPILPDFDLITLRAVQTIAGNTDPRFVTWFDALDYMYKEAMNKDFDVAIIGCGAYGFPLAARLKQAGKTVIHLGGATQLLFGIRGGRWDQRDKYNRLMTDAWVRPTAEETPANAQRVEDGCYW